MYVEVEENDEIVNKRANTDLANTIFKFNTFGHTEEQVKRMKVVGALGRRYWFNGGNTDWEMNDGQLKPLIAVGDRIVIGNNAIKDGLRNPENFYYYGGVSKIAISITGFGIFEIGFCQEQYVDPDTGDIYHLSDTSYSDEYYGQSMHLTQIVEYDGNIGFVFTQDYLNFVQQLLQEKFVRFHEDNGQVMLVYEKEYDSVDDYDQPIRIKDVIMSNYDASIYCILLRYVNGEITDYAKNSILVSCYDDQGGISLVMKM